MSKKIDQADKANMTPTQMSIRRFLKEVGLTTDVELMAAIESAKAKGDLSEGDELAVKMTFEQAELGLTHTVEGNIKL